MRTVILQTDIEWASPEVNARKMEQMLNDCSGGDLYILPEMWSTGFATAPQGIAEKNGESLAWMQRQARIHKAAFCGSVATEENGRYYNRMYFVRPDGETTVYDKRHLFAYGHENEVFEAGQQRVVVSHCGVRILLEVCYDLRFPVWSRNQGDFDMIVYAANWPTSRIHVWHTLLRARALENQCYVAGVNRIGEDPACSYCGGSVIISPKGEVLASCEDHTEMKAEADIDMEALNIFRKKFPVGADADEFIIRTTTK